MMRQNLHTHTTFGDGKNTAEEMARGAVSCGCTSLGFSEHSPLPPAADPDGWSMAEGDTSAYREEILGLREQYAGQLEIFLGLEQDMDSAPAQGHWDYLIGSVHSLWRDGCCLSVDCSPEATDRAIRQFFAGDPYAYAESYFSRVAGVADATGCQIAGHFDLLTKFNEGGRFFDERHPRYVDAAMGALEKLLKRDVIFEINTGAISRGYRTAPYPAPFLLRAIREKGGRVCITSDSHSARTVLFAFDAAEALARACGFRETWVLTEQGFTPQKL